MKTFRRRHYRGIRPFLRDLWFLVKNRRAVRRLTRGGLDPRFRERIMLAVTQVNQCRHCSYAHTRAALKEGLAEGSVRALLRGEFGDVPEAELAALVYAQHWAETAGAPAEEASAVFEAAYDADTAAQIRLALRIIRMGNYTGNSLDYLLYRVSFGRWGGETAEKAPEGAV